MAKSDLTKTTLARSACRLPIVQFRNDKQATFRSAFADAAEAADFDAEKFLRPWFRDPSKLIDALVWHALESPDIARQFVKAAATLAEQSPDKNLRGALRKALIPAKRRGPGRSKRSIHLCTMMANDEYYRQVVFGDSPSAANEFLAKRHNLHRATVSRYVAAGKNWSLSQKLNISDKD